MEPLKPPPNPFADAIKLRAALNMNHEQPEHARREIQNPLVALSQGIIGLPLKKLAELMNRITQQR